MEDRPKYRLRKASTGEYLPGVYSHPDEVYAVWARSWGWERLEVVEWCESKSASSGFTER